MKRYSVFILFLVLTFQLYPSSKAWVQRCEPSSWWVGMENEELQLMVYGQDIAQVEFSINYPGVEISHKVLTDNPNYVFLYLTVSKHAEPGVFAIAMKRGRKMQTISFELEARRQGSAQREGFSEADAVYLLMPDRFANGNATNDAVKAYHQGVDRSDPGARHGGDIEGVIFKVPYMADLGMTALWTTPLFENNDTQYSYHHYGCSDYYKIDPRLGENQDYIRLSDACHAHDMKLILDVVPNHCSSAHWWLADKPARNWFNEWETFTSSNYRMTAWTDPHVSQADLERLTKGWFAPNMPDFNLNNPLLFDYLTQVYIYWIEYANIDGLRIDTYPYNDIQVAANFIKTILDEYPNMNVVGECWVKTPAEIAYYQSGNNNKDGFDSQLQSVMDFCLKDVLTTAINEAEGWESGMARFYGHYAQDFVYANTHLIMNFLDNHDIDRFSIAVNRDVAKYKMGLALLITSRGYPQIYAGTEIMLDGIAGSYEGHRFDFPGGWLADERNAFTREGRTEEENEVFDYLKKLLHYRKNNAVLQSGSMKQFIPEDGMYVTFRYNDEKTVMIIANNNETKKKLNTSRFVEMLQSKTKATEITSGKEHDIKNFEISAKTVLILEIE